MPHAPGRACRGGPGARAPLAPSTALRLLPSRQPPRQGPTSAHKERSLLDLRPPARRRSGRSSTRRRRGTRSASGAFCRPTCGARPTASRSAGSGSTDWAASSVRALPLEQVASPLCDYCPRSRPRPPLRAAVAEECGAGGVVGGLAAVEYGRATGRGNSRGAWWAVLRR